MPCMCGDICCPSCGPAQGNARCALCNAWASDGCEHQTLVCVDCGATGDALDTTDTSETCGAHGHTVEARYKPEYEAAAERALQEE